MLHRLITLFLLTIVLAARAYGDEVICKKLLPGGAFITSNEFDIGCSYDLFDGDTTTLARSKALNPCWVQFVFPSAITVDSLNVYLGQPGGGWDLDSWTVETADNVTDLNTKSGSYVMLKPRNEPKAGGWDFIRLNSPHTAKVWRFMFYRDVGDAYVHIYEIGLFQFTKEATITKDYPLASEIKANNVVYKSSGYVPCKPVFDGSFFSYFQFTGEHEAYVTLSFVEPQTFECAKVIFLNNCSWRIGWADTYADVRDKAGTYTESELRDAKAGTWDSLVANLPAGKKYWKFMATGRGDTVRFGEIAFRTANPPENLTGLTKKLTLWENWRWRNVPQNLIYKCSEFAPTPKVSWSSSDETVATVDKRGTITAKKAGKATITATYRSSSCATEVTVLAPVKPLEKELVSTYLSTPRQNCIYEMPVLIIQYLPSTDGTTKDPAYSPDLWDLAKISLQDAKGRTLDGVRRFKYAIEEGSRFRGYKNPNAPSSIGIKVVDLITVYEPFPPGIRNSFYNSGTLQYAYDFDEMFEKINLKDYVENKGVKQVWIWGGGTHPYMSNYDFDVHTPEGSCRASFESYMATPTNMPTMNGHNPEPLPVYNKTYTVINQSIFYPDFTAVNFEPFTHQYEALLRAQNWQQDGNDELFWDKFVGKRNRCGWTHMPPNTEINYGYFHYIQADTNLVKPEWCDIENWTPSGGEKTLISYHSWEDIQHQWPDGKSSFPEREELQWFIYWLQAIPGYENNIPYEANGKKAKLTNWWRFWYDWDTYAHDAFGLWEYDNISAPDGTSEPELTLSPNPASDFLRLKSSSQIETTIYTALGQPIFRATAPCEVDISNISAGVYTVRYGEKTKKFIKVK